MKKFFLTFFVFFASAGYILSLSWGGASAAPAPLGVPTDQSAPVAQTSVPVTSLNPTPAPIPPTQPKQTQPTTPKPTPTLIPSPAPVSKPKGQYVDGTYMGSQADAYYGIVQVQVVIQNGALATVNFLSYPNDRRTSQYINSQAMPLLKQEAIQAQSADVSGVSGASDTSAAFRESLASALAQAK